VPTLEAVALRRFVDTDARAEDLVERLRTDWIGERWDNIVIEDVQLLSPGDGWPAKSSSTTAGTGQVQAPGR
jgi:hypothetical protein